MSAPSNELNILQLFILSIQTFTSKVSNVPSNFTCISHPASSKVITNCNKAINAAKRTAGAKRGVTGKINLTPLCWNQPATVFHCIEKREKIVNRKSSFIFVV